MREVPRSVLFNYAQFLEFTDPGNLCITSLKLKFLVQYLVKNEYGTCTF